MELKRRATIIAPHHKTIMRSELAILSACNSKRVPLAVNDYGVRREWVGIGWIDVCEARGDEVVVLDKVSKIRLRGRFAIVLPETKRYISRTKRQLWEVKQEAEFRLEQVRKTSHGKRSLRSAYVGEIGKDFWPNE
ncbi:MAG: hypothetical protein HY735_19085 [Verrucomicrobia bacterium]|nr:hypothetical protein [Verrucomicrobiota bacterium]